MTSFQLLHLPPLPPFYRRPGGGQVCIFTARRHCVPGNSSETASRQPKLGLPLPVIGGRGISTTHSFRARLVWALCQLSLNCKYIMGRAWDWSGSHSVSLLYLRSADWALLTADLTLLHSTGRMSECPGSLLIQTRWSKHRDGSCYKFYN